LPGKESRVDKQVEKDFVTADGGSYEAPVLEMKKLGIKVKLQFAWFYSPGHGAGELALKLCIALKSRTSFGKYMTC
jgi:hypothetical protein